MLTEPEVLYILSKIDTYPESDNKNFLYATTQYCYEILSLTEAFDSILFDYLKTVLQLLSVVDKHQLSRANLSRLSEEFAKLEKFCSDHGVDISGLEAGTLIDLNCKRFAACE